MRALFTIPYLRVNSKKIPIISVRSITFSDLIEIIFRVCLLLREIDMDEEKRKEAQ